MRTISELIKAAGGAKAISEAIADRGGKVEPDSIYKWPTIGIQDRHWPVFIEKAAATPSELFEANRAARETELTPAKPQQERAAT